MAKKVTDPFAETMTMLEDWRRHRGLTSEKMAEGLLVSPTTWRRYVRRESEIPFELLIRALNFLQVPYEDAIRCVTTNLRVAKAR